MEQKVYRAHCAEHGDLFGTVFKTAETGDDRLMEIGNDLAIGWGASCYKIEVLENHNLEGVYDADEDISKLSVDDLFARMMVK